MRRMVVLGRRGRPKGRRSRAPLKQARGTRARARGEHGSKGWHAQAAETRVVLVVLVPWRGIAFLAAAGGGAAADGRDDEGREGGSPDGHALAVLQQGLNLLLCWVRKAVVGVLLVRRCAALVVVGLGGRGLYVSLLCAQVPSASSLLSLTKLTISSLSHRRPGDMSSSSSGIVPMAYSASFLSLLGHRLSLGCICV
jgi:hypothetical protein